MPWLLITSWNGQSAHQHPWAWFNALGIFSLQNQWSTGVNKLYQFPIVQLRDNGRPQMLSRGQVFPLFPYNMPLYTYYLCYWSCLPVILLCHCVNRFKRQLMGGVGGGVYSLGHKGNMDKVTKLWLSCYPVLAKTGNKTAAVPWPDPYPVKSWPREI